MKKLYDIIDQSLKGRNMKTVKYEIKLERSVKIILGVLAVGILLHALPMTGQRLFSKAEANSNEVYRVTLCNQYGYKCNNGQ
tara:strand:+ start:229 stop:474 length:246 start_codon:yes stop_codon:yes gene_type:complete